MTDTSAGHRSYGQHLAWQMENGPAGKNRAYESMSQGWALGSGAFKKELLHEHHLAAKSRAWDAVGAKELREARWQEALDAAVSALPGATRQNARKSAPWKVAVACHLKATTDVSNGWLAQQLGMGSGLYVSKHAGLARRAGRNHESTKLLGVIARKVKGKA